MSSRHVEEGAGAEYVDPRDTFCDVCNRTIYNDSLRAETYGGSTLWKCGDCRAKDRERYERMVGAA